MRRKTYAPKWSDACLCGSEKKYKSCCKWRLPKFEIGNAYTEFCGKDLLSKALLAARADVTQYTLWHRAHTEPALLAGVPKELFKLFSIDIEALAAYVDRLFRLYYHTGRKNQIPTMLAGVSGNISHEAWTRKIQYLTALFELAVNEDRDAAKRELHEIEPITPEESDVELLQIFLDLCSDTLGFGDRIKFIDRILEISEDRGDFIQYQGNKAYQYLMVKDFETAKELFSEIVVESRKFIAERPLDTREQHFFALSLQMLGDQMQDVDLQQEALEQFHHLLVDENSNSRHKAEIYRFIGDSHNSLKQWKETIASYQHAYSLNELPIYRLLEAEALVHGNMLEEAHSVLSDLSEHDFSDYESADYVLIYSYVQTKRQEREGLQEAKRQLQNLKIREPLFNEQRLNLLVNVTSLLDTGSLDREADRKSTDFLKAISRFLIMQPNVFGLGVNLNAIIDRLATKTPPEKDKPDN